MRQKVFSWRDRFTVWDEAGNDRYYVEGKLFSWGKQLSILNTAGVETAFIKQRVLSLRPRYFVFVDGNMTAEIVKQITFLKPKYSIEGLGWDIQGNFWAHDYAITQNGDTIVTIHKQYFTVGDCYVLDIADGQDEITALAVTLAIDCVQAQNASASS